MMTKQDKKMVKCAKECDSIGEMACPNNTVAGGVCYTRLMTACGIIGEAEIIAIAERLVHARTKHPDNGGSILGSIKAMGMEMAEVQDAFGQKDITHMRDECLDVVACAVRLRGAEYA